MDDSIIVDLFLSRDESAIVEAEVCPECAYAGRNPAKDSRIQFYGIPEGKEQHDAV